MKKKIYVIPECQVVSTAQVVLFGMSGDDEPITPGIGGDGKGSDGDNANEFHSGSNIWDE